MKKRKRNVSRSLIIVGVFGLLAWIIWQKVRVSIVIPMSPLQALLAFLMVGVVLFLVVDHLFNRKG